MGNLFKNKYIFINIAISTFLGILIIYFIPNEVFEKYHLKKVSEEKIKQGTNFYYIDIDNDGEFEKISYERTKQHGNAITFKLDGRYLEVHNLKIEEYFLSDYLTFGDFDKNNIKEVYFISCFENASFLNSIEYDKHTGLIAQKARVFIDSVKYRNNKPDIASSYIQVLQNKVLFNLMAKFSIQPRAIYSYDLKNKKLLKSPRSSLHIANVKVSDDLILASTNIATGNTVSPDMLRKLALSKQPDTIKTYQRYQSRVYQNGDFSSYTMAFDADLNFKFPPIEHRGWTKTTHSDFIKIQGKKHIISLTISEKDTQHIPTLEIINLEGRIIQRKSLANYTGTRGGNILTINPINNQIYLNDSKKNLLISFNEELKQIKKIQLNGKVTILGFKDLNNDQIPEFLLLYKDKIEIYQNDLKSKNTLPLYYSNSWDKKILIETYQEFNNKLLHLGLGDSEFVVKYYQNRLYIFKYPFYVLLIVVLYVFIVFVQAVQSKQVILRLTKEKEKLELLVAEQTREIREEKQIVERQNEELNMTLEQLRITQNQLVQSEKMVSLGQLTAGLAHEMNNPLNFVQVGVDVLRTNIEDFIFIHKKYKNLANIEEKELKNTLNKIKIIEKEIDFEETLHEMKVIIDDVYAGSSRITQIVASLRDFSHLNQVDVETVDIHTGLDASLLLLSSPLSEKNIEIIKKYDRTLTKIDCFAREINQVFMIILGNAIDALSNEGKIIITTKKHEQNIEISFKDTGSGIKKEIIGKIFDPFFTTKDIGKGKGLGLATAYGIIQKHQGSIEVESEEGKGTEFIISIPQSL